MLFRIFLYTSSTMFLSQICLEYCDILSRLNCPPITRDILLMLPTRQFHTCTGDWIFSGSYPGGALCAANFIVQSLCDALLSQFEIKAGSFLATIQKIKWEYCAFLCECCHQHQIIALYIATNFPIPYYRNITRIIFTQVSLMLVILRTKKLVTHCL